MPADRDRLSFDANQRYRSVVVQQGRVMVPADFNEAEEIFGEEQRAEALDFVGPAGTPDNGYALQFPSPSPNFDFNIRPGTMYVGGLRVVEPVVTNYLGQPDWLDAPPAAGAGREYVFLRLQEREISAVEDSTLREVALGGPDTTQRTRILQRIVRVATTADDCGAALKLQNGVWANEGWRFEPATMRLNSVARLQVGFDTSGVPPGPCEPAASGGYLGAENQLIRVRISAAGKFTWGFDNASVLYRVDVVDSQTVRLQTPPVDTAHFPRAGQVIELLRSEARLANNELVAHAAGQVVTLAEAYNPDTQTIKLPAALGNTFIPPNGTPRLFLRVWEQELSFTPGTPVTLGNTGLTVTITLTTPAELHTGDFWAFAARPSTPVQVYPQRYLAAPQPPDGPRVWVCPLAIVEWTAVVGATGAGAAGGTAQLIADCREQFDDLVELTRRRGGCCTVTLSPASLRNTTLTQLIQNLPAGVPAKICLLPGNYVLDRPIEIRRNDITIESCPDGAVLDGQTQKSTAMRFGMMILRDAQNIAIRGLQFLIPESPAGSVLGLKVAEVEQTLGGPAVSRIAISGGIRVINCQDVAIENCRFAFPQRSETASVFGFGVAATGPVQHLSLVRNVFDHSGLESRKTPPAEFSATDFRVWVGLVQSAGVVATKIAQGGSATGLTTVVLDGELSPGTLDGLDVRDNTFTQLTAPVLTLGDARLIRAERNTATDCYSGFWFVALHTTGFADRVFTIDHKDLGTRVDWRALLADPVMQMISTFARSIEIPFGSVNPRPYAGVAITPQQPFPAIPNTDLGTRFFRLWTALAAIEQKVYVEFAGSQVSCHAAHNQVICAPAKVNNSDVTGPSLVIWGDDMGPNNTLVAVSSAAIVHANRLRAALLRHSALVLLTGSASVTGNLVYNDAGGDGSRSMIVQPAGAQAAGTIPALVAVAVTGNVCRGAMDTPLRSNVPAPFNTWDVLNTVLP